MRMRGSLAAYNDTLKFVRASSRVKPGTGQPRITEIKKRQRKEKDNLFILLFLDEKKQKSHT
jgi:hypothetical protein